MILDPINSVTSVSFYRKVAGQTLGRTVGYLCYLAFLFTLTTLLAVKIRVMPGVHSTFEWLEKTVPELTLTNGKLTSSVPGPTVIRHPDAQEIGVVIDTSRAEPVTPALLEENKAIAFVTSTAFYLKRDTGRLEVQDFSKANAPKPVVINADFWRAAGEMVPYFLYPAAMIFTFPLFLFWKAFSTGIYMILALLINALAQGGLNPSPLLNITVYAQTLLVLLEMILLLVPAPLPLALQTLASIGVTGTYIWLAVQAVKQDPPPAPSAPSQ